MPSKKEKITDAIKEVRNGLNEINSAHEPAINVQIDGTINMLKKYIIVKQTKLGKYMAKLQELTHDNVANGLLNSINYQLTEAGDMYGDILKLENLTPESSELENMEFMLLTCSKLFEVILKLQMVEELLDTDSGDTTFS